MNALILSLISTGIISLISLIGVISLAFKDKLLKKILFIMIGFSAGALIGGALLHLIPEALEGNEALTIFLIVIAGFSSFFIIERFLFWHHCHEGKCDVHTFTYMNLIGDGVHNLIDGMVIAASFVTSIPLGIVTSLAVISHEIPQEIGDFAVLVYGGFKKTKALLANFMTALTAVLGAILGYVFSGMLENFTVFLVPFAAGGFIYIAASDLIPELHKEADLKRSFLSFAFFIIGIIFMYMIKMIFEGG